MWMIKKTASSVYKTANKNIKKLGQNIPNLSNISQKVKIQNVLSFKKKQKSSNSQVLEAINKIIKNKKQVIPTTKMNIINEMSYQMQKFEQIVNIIIDKLQCFKYSSKQAKQTLNVLVLVNYLLKHGASGFIDQFRQQIKVFQSHSQLSLTNAYITDNDELAKLRFLLMEIRERAEYITVLLKDKKKLLKQKEIAMIVRQKVIMNRKQGLRSNLCEEADLDQHTQVDSFLEHYVWKNWRKFDDKMETLTERIIEKIDEYLDLEQPESFDIDEVENEEIGLQVIKNDKTQLNMIIQQENQFVNKKDEINKEIKKEKNGPVLDTELI